MEEQQTHAKKEIKWRKKRKNQTLNQYHTKKNIKCSLKKRTSCKQTYVKNRRIISGKIQISLWNYLF